MFGKDDDPHPPAEVAAVNGHKELEAGGPRKGFGCEVMHRLFRTGSNELASKQEQEGGRKHQPRQNPHKGMCRSAEQEQGPDDSSKHACRSKSCEQLTGHMNLTPEGPTAEQEARPERHRIRRVRRYRRDPGDEQRGKSDEAAPASDRIERSRKQGGSEKQRHIRNCELKNGQTILSGSRAFGPLCGISRHFALWVRQNLGL
jgi:hypothetical protein